MPVRIGFADHRRRLLQQELARILESLPLLGIEKAVLIGPMATDQIGSSSDIELVIVHDTGAPFAARPDFFFSHLEPRVGLQAYVYTPEELEELRGSDTPLGRALASGVEVYSA